MPLLRARLLGRPAFETDGEELACASRKALWLAAYVLVEGGKFPRARLAAMLWGGDSGRHALGSLRVALTKLPPAVLACLEVTRDAIGVNAGAECSVDVNEFIASCDDADLAVQRRAVELYGGDLLEGVEGDLAPEFSDWLFAKRSQLRQLAHDAHLRVAQRLNAQGERERAREVANAWLRRDPASESMHRLVMTWLSQGEGSDQALAHYEVYRRARAVAHGAAPSEEMSAFADRLRHGRDGGTRESPARITAATSFIGRTEELAELRGLFADPSCRLLTLHGLGGVGKTRLAVALADLEAPHYPGGVYVVPFDVVASPRLFAQTLARACGLQPVGSADPLDLVAAYLRDRAALLVLDNLEHLLGEPDDDPRSVPALVGRLLAGTGPNVKIVATSREPLRLQEEWLFALSGLAHPGENDAAGDAQGYAAVQFFAQRARQAYVGFSLAAELPNVVRICSVLEGLPLGLELAASWVRSVPCAEIAASLRSRAAELRTFHVNRPSRHHSLGAVVAYSWERLPAEQREALEGLAALVGTFSREAAEHVAHANVRTLSSLSEKSLLQPAGSGRWRMHEVVRQFAWETPGGTAKAKATRQAAVVKRRDAFYLDVLREAQVQLAGEREAEAIARIDAEAPNIRATWRSFANAKQVAELEQAAPAWFEFLECRCFFSEGVDVASQWLEAAERCNDIGSRERARAMLGIFRRFSADNAGALEALTQAVAALETLDAPAALVAARSALAFTLLLMGRLEEAETQVTLAHSGAEALGDKALIAAACRTRGLVALHSGKREAGRDLERRALDLAIATGKPSLRASAHNNLAMAENHLGNYAAAQSGYENALSHWRELHATANIGRAMHNLGVVATRMGDHSTALERYRAALEVLRLAGDRNLIALNLMSTGDALVRLGRAADARVPLEQALAMAERDGNVLPALDARIVLSQAALATGDTRVAAEHLAAAFEGAEKHHFTNVLADGVLTAARLLVALRPDAKATAREWTGCIAQLSDVSESLRNDARRLLEELPGGTVPAAGALDDRVASARAAIEAIRRAPAKAGAVSVS